MFFNSRLEDFETRQDRGLALDDGYEGFWRLSRTPRGGNRYLIDDSGTYRQLLRTNFIKTSGTSIPRDVLARVGAFDESLKNADDWDMWLRIAKHYPLGLIDAPEVIYHIRSGNISSRGHHLLTAQMRVLEKQLQSNPDPLTRKVAERHLADDYLSLGWALRQEGQAAAARAHYRRSLSYAFDHRPLRGWCLTWLPGGRRPSRQ